MTDQLQEYLPAGYKEDENLAEFLEIIGEKMDAMQEMYEGKLQEASREADIIKGTRDHFLCNISHEIRTPMNAITGISRLLRKSGLNEQQLNYLDGIQKATETLLLLFNNILEISKSEAGRLTLDQVAFRPAAVIRQCLHLMNPKAEEKGITLLNENSPDDELVLTGDRVRLKRILLNLTDNAIKFTEEGSVRLRTHIQPADNNNYLLSFTLQDTGIGMEPAFLSLLFRNFTQEDFAPERKYGGTGLGLSITKQLVDLMQGSIEVSSTKGKGTIITVTIPFAAGCEEDLPEKKMEKADPQRLKNSRILLADDNEMNRLVVSVVLQQAGCRITEVHNGSEAVNAVRKEHFDLVLMDVQMPLLNGLEATRIIREELNRELPVIALTANAIQGEADKCLQAGMNDYISKPFTEEELTGTISRWLPNKVYQGVMEPVTDEETTLPRQPLFNLSKLEKLGGGNTAFVQKMTSLFIRQLPADLKELRLSAKEGDWAKMRSLAHRMKPSLDNMGIDSMYGLIRELEAWPGSDPADPQLAEKLDSLETTVRDVVYSLQNPLPVPSG